MAGTRVLARGGGAGGEGAPGAQVGVCGSQCKGYHVAEDAAGQALPLGGRSARCCIRGLRWYAAGGRCGRAPNSHAASVASVASSSSVTRRDLLCFVQGQLGVVDAPPAGPMRSSGSTRSRACLHLLVHAACPCIALQRRAWCAARPAAYHEGSCGRALGELVPGGCLGHSVIASMHPLVSRGPSSCGLACFSSLRGIVAQASCRGAGRAFSILKCSRALCVVMTHEVLMEEALAVGEKGAGIPAWAVCAALNEMQAPVLPCAAGQAHQGRRV